MSNTAKSARTLGLRKVNGVTKRIVSHSTGAGRFVRSARAGRFLPATVRTTRPAARMRSIDHPRSIEGWEEKIRSLVSSFEIAAQDVTSRVDLNYEVTFDLRETGLTLEWLSEVFRNLLGAVEVPETRDITMKADLDAIDAGEVTIQLLSALRRPAKILREERNGPGERTGNDAHRHHGDELADSGVIELDSATGKMSYELPLSLSEEALSSMEVSAILSPSGKPNRALANSRRKAHLLLGVQVGNQYRYPRFQFDLERQRVHPVVEHANRGLECDLDPWGTLDWWFTDNAIIDGDRPVDRLARGRLTEREVDLMIDAEHLGMD